MEEVDLWIKRYEGLKLEPYVDTTGNLTIGYGRNLKNGISKDEAELMFKNDLSRATKELFAFGWFLDQSNNIQTALINMNFNLGINKLLSFKRMIAALTTKNYTLAAQEALDSLWARQVGVRAKDIALMIRQG